MGYGYSDRKADGMMFWDDTAGPILRAILDDGAEEHTASTIRELSNARGWHFVDAFGALHGLAADGYYEQRFERKDVSPPEPVPADEVSARLRHRWRGGAEAEQAWQEWASNVRVYWKRTAKEWQA